MENSSYEHHQCRGNLLTPQVSKGELPQADGKETVLGREALASGLFRAAHRALPTCCARLCSLKSPCCSMCPVQSSLAFHLEVSVLGRAGILALSDGLKPGEQG